MYAKLVAAVIAAGLSAAVAALTDGTIGQGEAINIAIVVVGACAVFAAPNVPGAPVTKAVIAVLTAVLTLAASLITDGLNLSDWLQLAVAALGALGVYAVPNRGGATV